MKKISLILKNKKGASILFVLAIMILLMTIGTSVLVASSTATRELVSQQTQDGLLVYAESINKAFLYSLQANDDDTNPKFLGRQLLMSLYNYKETGDLSKLPKSMEMTFDKYTPQGGITEKPIFKITFPKIDVAIRPAIPAIYSVDGVLIAEREPKSATINATMSVTAEIANKDKTIIMISEYTLIGGYLEDTGEGMPMRIVEAGKWRLESYGKLDK